jgi:hypothetical protein
MHDDRRNDRGKLKYKSGSYRVQSDHNNDALVSRVGYVNPQEVYAAENEKILPIQSNKVLGDLIRRGVKKLPTGTKFIDEYDENGKWLAPDGKRYSYDAKIIPTDIIRITNFQEEKLNGWSAQVYRVRNERRGLISARVQGHPVDMGRKIILEDGQYKLIKRPAFDGLIPEDDMLSWHIQKGVIEEDEN